LKPKLNNPVPELTPMINEIDSLISGSIIQKLNAIKPWTEEQIDRFLDTGEMPDEV